MTRYTFLANMALAVLMTFATGVVLAVPVARIDAAHAATTNFEAAVVLHNAARDGKSDAKAAVQALEEFTATEPDKAQGWAYLGSAYAIRARDSVNVTDKVRFTNRGLRYLDRAVELAPQDFVVRLVRANVELSLPSMFGREASLVEDLMTLDAMYQAAGDPHMAGPMVGIYDALATHAAGVKDWSALKAAAEAAAGRI